MIKSITQLDPKTKLYVLKELQDRGANNSEHYCRYSYSDFISLGSFISTCEMDVTEQEMTSIFENLNTLETKIVRQIVNQRHSTIYDAPKLKLLTDKTRSAIKRILKLEYDETLQTPIPVETRLTKLKQALFN